MTSNKFNFEKLRKHTEYTLSYELIDMVTKDKVEFEIQPVMSDRTSFMELVSKKNVKPEQIVDWFSELALKGEDASIEETAIFKEFALSHYGEIQTQTMIGFKLTTKEDLDERINDLTDKLLEKNL